MIDFGIWEEIKGFMAPKEAKRLFEISLEASQYGPVIEIGSYCGKSAYVIGSACRQTRSILFSIDHHTGSEEQQPGQAYYDPDLYDTNLSRVNTFPFFQDTLIKTDLEGIAIPVVTDSVSAGKMWETPISMLFIDGGHSFEAANNDYITWAPHLIKGGFLVMHDIFFNPEEGGQAPRKVYDAAVGSGNYIVHDMIKTLGVLERI